VKRAWQLLRVSIICLSFLAVSQRATAEESSSGISMPFTISGIGLHTHRFQTKDAGAANAAAGFRAMLYPSVKLGSHWFGYAAIQVRSEPYFFEETYSSQREVEAQWLQAFLGYSRVGDSKSLLIKAGQLSSAFGSFLPRYDDSVNPLIDWPLSYGYYYKPVSFAGVTGVEVDVSIHRLDTRLQLANSSPAHPVGVSSGDQHPQWAGGAGYTVRHGLRIGLSAYRGPYMLRASRFLSEGDQSADYRATGVGLDVQWARGRWSASGEWQRFSFPYPRIPAAVGNYGYAETKVVLTPRWYAALRAGYQDYNHIAPDRQNYDFVLGYRPNRFQLIKVGYQWLRETGVVGTRDDVWAVQYVTSIDSLQKSFR